MNYGDRLPRFVAGLLDGLVIFAIQFVVVSVMGLAGASESATSLGALIGLVVGVLYYVVYQSQNGQTVGKKIMRLKVVDASGNKPTMVTFFLREIIGKFLSGLILLIGYLMILWDSKRQGLHDKIANTYVVKVT